MFSFISDNFSVRWTLKAQQRREAKRRCGWGRLNGKRHLEKAKREKSWEKGKENIYESFPLLLRAKMIWEQSSDSPWKTVEIKTNFCNLNFYEE